MALCAPYERVGRLMEERFFTGNVRINTEKSLSLLLTFRSGVVEERTAAGAGMSRTKKLRNEKFNSEGF